MDKVRPREIPESIINKRFRAAKVSRERQITNNTQVFQMARKIIKNMHEEEEEEKFRLNLIMGYQMILII